MVAMLGLLLVTVVSADNPPAGPPDGIEVQGRGPVHEAFASPTTEPTPTRLVPKKPPRNIEELPPEQKPAGQAVWIPGYWAYDDDRNDFLWVSGVWRVPPHGKTWVAGYWRQEGDHYQWVPGFWTDAAAQDKRQITYLPAPPEPPASPAPGAPSRDDAFYVPGCWIWRDSRYVWRAGYWARLQPGYVWIADHYRWTPSGYVFVPGYWDLALPRRGILYAPVVVRPALLQADFVYTPTYAVQDTLLVEALFVRPSTTHYYFGDYYGLHYNDLGFEACVVYSRRHYEPVIVYEAFHRRDPTWVSVQINLWRDRCTGRAALPPRTLVQQNTLVQNTTNINNITNITNINNVTHVKNISTANHLAMVAPAATVAAKKEIQLEAVDNTTRRNAALQARSIQRVATQRAQTEVKPSGMTTKTARAATLEVPPLQPIQRAGQPPTASTSGRTPPAQKSPAPMPPAQKPPAETPPAQTAAGVSAGTPRARMQPPPAEKPAVPAATNPATKPTITPSPPRVPNSNPNASSRPIAGPRPTEPPLPLPGKAAAPHAKQPPASASPPQQPPASLSPPKPPATKPPPKPMPKPPAEKLPPDRG